MDNPPGIWGLGELAGALAGRDSHLDRTPGL